MRLFLRRALANALVVAASQGATACAAGGTASTPSNSPNVIEAEEIVSSSASNAYDLIRQVRPNWLRGRGASTSRGGTALPVVYLGSVRQGGVETLQGFATNGIATLRFVDAVSATTRYGDGHGGGVIEVVLRRR